MGRHGTPSTRTHRPASAGAAGGHQWRECFSILARSAEGRGRSTGPVARPDSTLLSVYHSWTIVSVTAVTFTARSVHSRAADPNTLHFHGLAAARARSMAIGILPAVARPSPRLLDTVAERLGFAQTSFVPCWRVRCHAFLRLSTLTPPHTLSEPPPLLHNRNFDN